LDGKRKLAESYKNVGRYKKSEETYSQICSEREATAEDFYNYSFILRINGNYAESETWMKKFSKLNPKDLRAKDYMAGKSGFGELLSDDGQFNIKNLDINTKEQDFGAVFYNEKIVYASSKEAVKPVKRSYNWNGKPFLDLYSAEIGGDDQFVNSLNFQNFNKNMHEGPAAFAKQGTLMAFTRNNYDGKSQDGVVKLQIFFSEFKDGIWQKEQAFKLNSSEYSVGHPCLSADGNTMYFASDMSGGYGAADIYKISRTEGGEWGEAVNLGDRINTEGDEMFPFVEEKTNYLYFASSGHLGLGGLDLFLAVLKPDKIGKIINMGFPLNGQYDDFALIIDTDAKKGYFSSNRTEGKGDDDIYAFELLKPFTFEKIISGKVSDTNKNFLPGSVVRLYDKDGNVVDSTMADENAFFSFIVDADDKQYDLVSNRPKYKEGKNTANTAVSEDMIVVDLVLERVPEFSLYGTLVDKNAKTPVEGAKVVLVDKVSGKKEEFVSSTKGDFTKQLSDSKLNDVIAYNVRIEKQGYFAKVAEYKKTLTKEGQYNLREELDADLIKFEVGMDLGKVLGIYPIYFDYDKFNIRTDAAVELEKIIKVMNENPTMEVELGSHTDCRGLISYNKELAENRAKASAEYVKQRINNPERIYGRGYGEDKLKNNCACEGALRSACPEEQHQQNRRTEFIIIKVN